MPHVREEFEAIFVLQRPLLCCIATKILGSRELADDVVQDAYLKISQADEVFVVRQPIAYILRVVRNLAIDRRRRYLLESTVFTSEEEGVNVSSVQGSPEAIIIDRQALGLVAQALDELPDRTRRAFELYRFDGLTQREVAEHLGVSTTLVNFMIRDALQHCRTSLHCNVKE